MSDIADLSEARRSLLERYLSGDFQHITADRNDLSSEVEIAVDGKREGVIPVQTGGSKRPFFYLYGDWTGRAFYCYPFAQALGDDQPFYLLEPYNFDDLPVPPTFEEMAAAHLKSMRTIQPEGPYLLGGWCNGGLLAYEMALQLLAEGQKVDLLVLMDADGPHPAHRRLIRRGIHFFCKPMRLGQEKQVDVFLLVQHIFRYLRFSHYRLRFSGYRRTENSERLGTIEQSGSKSKRSKVDHALQRLDQLIPMAATLRQDWPSIYEWIAYDYEPNMLYPGKITFFWDSEDTWRPVWWRKIIKAKANEAEVHVIPGSHYSLRMEDLNLLAEHLRTCLSKVQGSRSDHV